uniref:Putative secreted protein n=1 Tax=Ixodes ricinus TaxID=34613 RepID=A0A0K8RKJ3_IXORI
MSSTHCLYYVITTITNERVYDQTAYHVCSLTMKVTVRCKSPQSSNTVTITQAKTKSCKTFIAALYWRKDACSSVVFALERRNAILSRLARHGQHSGVNDRPDHQGLI